MGQSLGARARGGFQGASDFKLLDRQVVDAVRQCPERHRFFRGLVAWVGFRVVELPFEVRERAAGESKWSALGLVRYSLANLLSFTALPLRLIAAAGAGLLLFTVLLAVFQLVRSLRGDSLAGFPTVILLQLIFGSVLLTSLGVIALYLAEMYDELKQRPVYLYRARDPARDPLPARSAPTTLLGTTPDAVSQPPSA
jgi:dolichol-phosphate mannosyltransferase